MDSGLKESHMARVALIAGLVLLGSVVFAEQQQPPADPAMLHRVINSLVQQRNAALDAAALAEAKAAQLAEDVQKLKAEMAAKDAKPQ
jgi:hypothetical protein